MWCIFMHFPSLCVRISPYVRFPSIFTSKNAFVLYSHPGTRTPKEKQLAIVLFSVLFIICITCIFFSCNLGIYSSAYCDYIYTCLLFYIFLGRCSFLILASFQILLSLYNPAIVFFLSLHVCRLFIFKLFLLYVLDVQAAVVKINLRWNLTKSLNVVSSICYLCTSHLLWWLFVSYGWSTYY